MKQHLAVIAALCAFTASALASVNVTTPVNGSTVTTTIQYDATASTSTCSRGVASMGIYVDNVLEFVSYGATLSTTLPVSPGAHNTVVEEWDYCGGASYTPVHVNVVQGGTEVAPQGHTLSNLQASPHWTGYGEFAPTYDVCSSGCSGVYWSQYQHLDQPSLSGNATRFDIGGSVPYSDVLWTNPLIGDNTSQGLPDSGHTLLPSIHNFTYDTYVYVTNWSITQSLEFDVSMYMNGAGMIWGTQCDHLADGTWDVWDNVHAKWTSTGIGCSLNNNAWNHVTLQLERRDDNTVTYGSVTVNGITSAINRTFQPFSVPRNWWGVTVNYQMDGNYHQASNTTYVDNFNLTYR